MSEVRMKPKDSSDPENPPPTAILVPWHGEGRTLWYVVDTSAPEAEQPSVLVTLTRAEEAEHVRKTLER